ncbi:MAG: hypothetical protein AAFX87_13185 [Bacteroidota bacterium]
MQHLETISARWASLSNFDESQMAEVKSQLHQAVQLLGMVGRRILPHDPSDVTANLGWDDKHQALVSRPLAGAGETFKAGLKLKDFLLIIINDDALASTFELNGKTQGEAIAWLKSEFEERGFNSSNFDLELPYEIPEYPQQNGAPFEFVNPPLFDELGKYFANAQAVLEVVESNSENVSEIRCWPHHFDIATLITLKDTGDPETSSSVNVGFSPGDGSYNEPYFYVSPWPYPEKSQLPALESGFWNTEGYTAAILKGSEIVANGQDICAKRFITQSIDPIKAILG